MPKLIKIDLPTYTDDILGDTTLAISEQCWFCKRFNVEFNSNEKINCAAFNSGIPDEILNGEVGHTKPYKGDNGIVFEEIQEDE